MIEKNEKNSGDIKLSFGDPPPELAELAAGSTYVSETDAPWTAFKIIGDSRGDIADAIAAVFGLDASDAVTTAAGPFLDKLSAEKEGFSDDQRKRAERSRAMAAALKRFADDIQLIRYGKVRVEIFVAGSDTEGNICGIRTSAVET